METFLKILYAVASLGGLGILFGVVLGLADKKFAVEVDERLAPLLDETLAGFDNVKIVYGDVLKLDLAALIAREFAGLRVAVSLDVQEPAPKPPEAPGEGLAGSFWMHFAFTGPALFVRPSDVCCVCLLLHRRGPRGELLDLERLRARRWHLLEGAVAG